MCEKMCTFIFLIFLIFFSLACDSKNSENSVITPQSELTQPLANSKNPTQAPIKKVNQRTKARTKARTWQEINGSVGCRPWVEAVHLNEPRLQQVTMVLRRTFPPEVEDC